MSNWRDEHRKRQDPDVKAVYEGLEWLSILVDGWDDECAEKGCRCTFAGQAPCSQPARDAYNAAYDAAERLLIE